MQRTMTPPHKKCLRVAYRKTWAYYSLLFRRKISEWLVWQTSGLLFSHIFAVSLIFIGTYYETGVQILWKIHFIYIFVLQFNWLLTFFCISSESYALLGLLFRVFFLALNKTQECGYQLFHNFMFSCKEFSHFGVNTLLAEYVLKAIV